MILMLLIALGGLTAALCFMLISTISRIEKNEESIKNLTMHVTTLEAKITHMKAEEK